MILILLEAVLFCVFSAAIGLGLASIILPQARRLIGITSMPVNVIVTGLIFAVVLAIAGSSVPAWRGLKLRVADALADR
jgi:ABC-type antimicrobial peptide transport system permease subunit